ncbi:MAG: glycosyltransferase family 4 protein [Tepidisphaeraceae bacterium]
MAPTEVIPIERFTADQVLAPYVYVFYAAFLLAFVFTPVMRSVAVYYGIVDRPDEQRKLHKTPIAYLGGVAMFLGWIGGLAFSRLTALHYNPLVDQWLHVAVPRNIVVAAFIIVGLGLWDDLRSVNPKIKVLGQVAAACMLLLAGIGVNSTRPLLNPIDVRLIEWYHTSLPGWVYAWTGSCLTIALVVFCCNATNLMDGLDGLAGGVTAIIAAGFLFLAVYMGMVSGPENASTSALRIVLAIALLGAVLGFLPYNFNPASIFMGDTGSMFLGFACALMIVMMAELDTRWLLASMVMFALPVLDTSLAFARRWVNRRPVFSADRFHFHHQLVMRGLTVRKTVIVSYVLSIGFALLGSAIVFMRTRYAGAIYLVVFGSIIVAAYKMGMVHEKPQVVTRRPLGAAENEPPASVESGAVLELRSEGAQKRGNGDEG